MLARSVWEETLETPVLYFASDQALSGLDSAPLLEIKFHRGGARSHIQRSNLKLRNSIVARGPQAEAESNGIL
jgi:hypothetical protein